MKQVKIAIGVLVTALLLSAPLTALANDKEEIAMLDKATISLTEAIALAEEHVGGRAFAAEIDDDSFAPRFEVTVTKDGKVFDVQVDGEKGEVLGSREDLD